MPLGAFTEYLRNWATALMLWARWNAKPVLIRHRPVASSHIIQELGWLVFTGCKWIYTAGGQDSVSLTRFGDVLGRITWRPNTSHWCLFSIKVDSRKEKYQLLNSSLDGKVCRILQMYKTEGQKLYPCPRPRRIGAHSPCSSVFIGVGSQGWHRSPKTFAKVPNKMEGKHFSCCFLGLLCFVGFLFFIAHSWKESYVGRTRPGRCVF